MKEPGPGLKAICLAIYGPTGAVPSIVVAPLATGVSPNTNGRSTVAGAGVSREIAESCASIADGHFYNVDGETLIPSIVLHRLGMVRMEQNRFGLAFMVLLLIFGIRFQAVIILG